MGQADNLYNELVQEILLNGTWDKGMKVRTKWKDGTSAYSKSVIGRSLRFDNSELPILTGKEVKWIAAITEGYKWIWRDKSNVVEDLRNMGSNIWNEWEQPDGTIGKAYGYQLAKAKFFYPLDKLDKSLLDARLVYTYGKDYILLDQVDYLMQELKNNPASRRHITMLWNWDDMQDMSLTPCVYETQWHVKENKLYLEARARSNDLGLGHPFNVFQYNVLQRIMAQVLGYELGDYIFHIGDAHIYDRHIDTLSEQLGAETFPAPTLWINPDKKNFYDFDTEDFKLENYQHGKFRRMEVAI